VRAVRACVLVLVLMRGVGVGVGGCVWLVRAGNGWARGRAGQRACCRSVGRADGHGCVSALARARRAWLRVCCVGVDAWCWCWC